MSAPPLGLEEARARLRELGYLDGRVERFLFRRALEGRGGLVFLPAIGMGALAASVAALAAVDAAEPGFTSSFSAVASLVAHVFASDLAPAALIAALLCLWADRSRSVAGSATLVGLGSAAAIFTLWIGGVWGLAREIPAQALLWGAPVAVAALFLARSARSGFLARAYVHSRVLPARPRSKVFFGAAVFGVLVAVAIFASRRQPAAVSPPRPAPRSGSVVVVAADGLWLDSDPADRSTGLRELLARGKTAWWPALSGSPPEIWTDLSTGAPASRHGVRALERVRPRGSPLALRPPLGTSWYLRGLGPRVSLVFPAPVSPRDRKSLAFWEVAASAGLPSLSVAWWAAGPWPGADVVGNDQILRDASDGLAVDRAAVAAFRERRSAGQPLATLYLPGPDILRGQPNQRAVALEEIHRFLEDEVSRAISGSGALIVLAQDSHPGASGLGRMIVFDGATEPATQAARPEDVAASILSRAGIPTSRDLTGRPVSALFRPGSLDSGTVATYGPRVVTAAASSPRRDREYLEKLKSLGYLN